MAKQTPANLQPQAKLPPRTPFHEAPIRWLLKFQFFYRFRRRLVCPSCGAVGTWKPYGMYWRDIDKRRWLCKWCGYYDAVDGQGWCVISKKQTSWVQADSEPDNSFTPQKVAEKGRWNPWAGLLLVGLLTLGCVNWEVTSESQHLDMLVGLEDTPSRTMTTMYYNPSTKTMLPRVVPIARECKVETRDEIGGVREFTGAQACAVIDAGMKHGDTITRYCQREQATNRFDDDGQNLWRIRCNL